MLLQSLGNSLCEERQEGQLCALTSEEAVLSLATQLCYTGHIHFGNLSQLSGNIEGLTHTFCNNLADTCGLLDGTALGRNLKGMCCLGSTVCGGSCRCSGSSRSSRALSGNSCLNILLADTTAYAGALHSGQVNTIVFGELTNQRGYVCFAIGGGSRRGSGGVGCRSRSCRRSGSCRSRCCRSRCGGGRCSRSSCGGRITNDGENLADLCFLVFWNPNFEQGTCHGRRNLGIDLIGRNLYERFVYLDLLTNFLQPAGHGTLCDRLAQCGKSYFLTGGRASSGRRSSCGCLRSGRGGCCRSLGSGRGRCSCGSTGTIANDNESSANLNIFVFFHQDLLNNACYGRGDLGVDLIGRNLDNRIVHSYSVADSYKPAGHGAFGHGFAQCGQFYGVGHISSHSPCECLN